MLGFDVMVRGYPGALFVSAGGYHHHLGLNTWHSAGGSPPVEGSIGLRWYEVELPSAEALDPIVGRVRAAGIPANEQDGGVLIRDPSGIAVFLRRTVAAGPPPLPLAAPRRRGGVATQRPAKPSTPVRFRSSPYSISR